MFEPLFFFSFSFAHFTPRHHHLCKLNALDVITSCCTKLLWSAHKLCSFCVLLECVFELNRKIASKMHTIAPIFNLMERRLYQSNLFSCKFFISWLDLKMEDTHIFIVLLTFERRSITHTIKTLTKNETNELFQNNVVWLLANILKKITRVYPRDMVSYFQEKTSDICLYRLLILNTRLNYIWERNLIRMVSTWYYRLGTTYQAWFSQKVFVLWIIRNQTKQFETKHKLHMKTKVVIKMIAKRLWAANNWLLKVSECQHISSYHRNKLYMLNGNVIEFVRHALSPDCNWISVNFHLKSEKSMWFVSVILANQNFRFLIYSMALRRQTNFRPS